MSSNMDVFCQMVMIIQDLNFTGLGLRGNRQIYVNIHGRQKRGTRGCAEEAPPVLSLAPCQRSGTLFERFPRPWQTYLPYLTFTLPFTFYTG